MRLRLLAVAGLFGCSGVPAYRCASAAACGAGFCEEDGWCSAADPSCPSGRRYVAEAGDGLGGRCVDPAPVPDGPMVVDGRPIDATPAAPDASADAPPPDPFGPPVALEILNSPGNDGGPTATADGLELYFHSTRAGGFDIYRSTRADAGDPWGAPVVVAPVNGSAAETHPHVSADGLSLWLSSTRAGFLDIYLSTRTARSAPWGAPVAVTEVNSGVSDVSLATTSSSLLAVLASDRGGDYDLYFTARLIPTGAWQIPAVIGELDLFDFEADPFLFDDAKAIAFSASRTGGARDLYLARRPSPFGPFEAPTPFEELATDANDDAPWFTQDGRTVLFASDRDGDFDLYEARR